jgi:hypothetical protein
MKKFELWLRVAASGWLLTAVFGGTVLAMKGSKELAAGLVLIVVGLLMAWWLLARRSRPAVITSLILGALQLLEQVAYSAADFGDKHLSATTTGADIFGSVAALAIVVGSVMALVTRRAAQPSENELLAA